MWWALQILKGLWLVDGARGANVYLVALSDGVVIVDAGMRGSAEAIAAELRAAGFSAGEVRAVLVTHAHIDHIGGLPELQQRFGAPVLAHGGEADAIEGIAALPAPHGLRYAPLRLLSERFRPAPVPVQRRIEAGAALPEMPGWYVVATRGHTPDHVSLYHPERGWLIAGDALANFMGLGGSPAMFTSDTRLAKASVAMLAGLPLRTAMFGHGEPIVEDPRLPEQIAAVARR